MSPAYAAAGLKLIVGFLKRYGIRRGTEMAQNAFKHKPGGKIPAGLLEKAKKEVFKNKIIKL